MSQRQRLNLMVSSAVLAVIGLLLTVTASYAWLEISRIPFISDVAINVTSENALVIAPDKGEVPDKWETILVASDCFEEFGPLKPVTYNEEDHWFYKLNYTDSGRTNGVTALTEDEIYVSDPKNAEEKKKEESGLPALLTNNGYVIAYDLWMSTPASPVAVYLRDPEESPEEELKKGCFAVGRPEWSEKEMKHRNAAYGAETTVRIGFDITITDLEGKPTGETNFVVYEPNADIHPDGKTGYIETKSVKGKPLVSEENLAIQNASVWDDVVPVSEDTVVYKAGEFVQNPILFELNGKEMAKVRIWIWVEGQDRDCYALSYAEGVKLLCNLDFGAQDRLEESEIHRR